MENENEELLHDSENENVVPQSTEENVNENIENIETGNQTENQTEDVQAETERDFKKEFKNLLKEHPEYQENLNEMMKARLARQEKDLKSEYEKRYGRLENVVKAGLETDDIEEATNKLEGFYKERGINIPSNNVSSYDPNDVEKLAKIDAEEVIDLGFNEIIYETDRLLKKGSTICQTEKNLNLNILQTKELNTKTKLSYKKPALKKSFIKVKNLKIFQRNSREANFLPKKFMNYF